LPPLNTPMQKIQDEESLTLAKKLSKAHISYKTQKMKVKLADDKN